MPLLGAGGDGTTPEETKEGNADCGVEAGVITSGAAIGPMDAITVEEGSVITGGVQGPVGITGKGTAGPGPEGTAEVAPKAKRSPP